MTYDLSTFNSWLSAKGFSASTKRNYLVDLGKYLEYVNHLPQSVSLDISQKSNIHILSPDIVKLYVSYLSDKTNSSRYLASLRKFCQFALDQKLILADPFKNISRVQNSPDLSDLVGAFEQHLLKHQAPLSTVRNYINDLNQYISWLNSNPNPTQSIKNITSSPVKGRIEEGFESQ